MHLSYNTRMDKIRLELADEDAEVVLGALGWLVTGKEKGRSDSWSRSRICVKADGTQSTVLLELTRLLFPTAEPETLQPYWKDSDSSNEKFSNIATREVMQTADGKIVARRGKAPGNEFGVPSHSPEYAKAYYQKNKTRIAAAQKRYHDRLRAQRAAAGNPVREPSEQATRPKEFESYTEEMQERLERIAAMAGVKDEEKK